MTDKVTIVIGASSQIGYFLIPELLSRGGQVIAVSRQPVPAWFKRFADEPRLRWCNLEQLQQLGLPESGELVCAGPLSLAASLVAGLSPARVVVMGSASVLFKQNSSDATERKLISGILQAEEDLSAWAEKKQADLHILRPTLVYGCGLDKNLSRAAGLIKRFGFMPVAGQARGLRQPVHAGDIACLIIDLLDRGISGRHIWSLAGGSKLTYAEMMQAVFAAQAKPARLLRVPLWLLGMGSNFLPGVNRQMISRQNQDLCIDDSAARSELGWQPRPFILTSREFSTQQIANP